MPAVYAYTHISLIVRAVRLGIDQIKITRVIGRNFLTGKHLYEQYLPPLIDKIVHGFFPVVIR